MILQDQAGKVKRRGREDGGKGGREKRERGEGKGVRVKRHTCLITI